jgi:uncharacterized protein DUF1648
MTPAKWWSFAIVLAGVAGAIAILAVFAHDYPMSPATVPTHFGPSGAPDAWGPRSTFVIFPTLGGIFAAVAIVFWAFGVPVRPGGRPVPAILPLLVVLIFAETIWMLFFAQLGSFAVALGRAAGLSPGFIIGIAVVMVTAVVMLVASFSAARRAL